MYVQTHQEEPHGSCKAQALCSIKWCTHRPAGQLQPKSASHERQDTHSGPGLFMVFVKPHQQHRHHCLMITCGLAHCCFDVTPAGQHAHAAKEVLDPVSRLQLCLLCRVLRAQQNCPWLHADVLALWQTYSFSVLILVSHATLFPQLMPTCLGGSHVKNVLQRV